MNLPPTIPYLGEGNFAKDKYEKPESYLDDPDAIVIGSGLGGLSVASLFAQRKAWRVLVLEANAVPGGCTHCHELDGYEFPSGIGSVGDMDPSVGRGIHRPTMDYVTGGKLDWAEAPHVHEVAYYGDDRYEWSCSLEQNIAWIEKRFGDQLKPGQVSRRLWGLWWRWSPVVLLERITRTTTIRANSRRCRNLLAAIWTGRERHGSP